MQSSPSQAALSLAQHEQARHGSEKSLLCVDAAPKHLLPTSSLSPSVPLCVPFVPQSPNQQPQAAPPLQEEKPPPQPLPQRTETITAVLNVPNKAKVMAAVKESAAASHNHFHRNLLAQKLTNDICEQVPVTSKLDLAEKRRRDRRMKMNGGVPVQAEERQNHLPAGLLLNGNSIFASSVSTGSSDSEQDWDSDGETGSWRQQHLLLTKGPPCKLEITPQKLHFLQMFGLTTLAKRNDLELAKCERRFIRHWEEYSSLPLEVVEEEPEEVSPPPPELPYPCGSPDILNKSSDYNSKICFLRYLNLEPITPAKRAEREASWQQILSERVRRKSINAVVLYTSQQNQLKKEATAEEASLPKAPPSKSRLSKMCSPSSQLLVPRPSRPISPVNNGVMRPSVSKLSCLLPVAQRRASSSDEEEIEVPTKVPKWTGIEEVMEAYQKYSNECSLEATVLREQCQQMHQQLMEGRQKAEQLDTRLRELVARKNMHEFERHQIQSALDQLNSCLHKLR
ncbi:genetic suppressor element 1-like [Neocloeon triangulifer]|uniref:genetic suppressor element 1-like n=1 Tax=Neocloeon triangulifer TaxID=2078957 RepID=UPI00286F7B13|nr:genetic suppressor element 1-like [Neocloeon triangulifer]